MRNTKTHNKTIKKRLNKCRTIFHAYNDTQFRYGDVLNDIVEIRCNVKLDGFILGDNYTTDFHCIKDSSREYWLSKGIKDLGFVLDEE